MPAPAGPTVPGFGFANYRSFDENGFIVRNPKKVNIFIGKNNSGKSNVLRAIHLIARFQGLKLADNALSPVVDGHRQGRDRPTAAIFVSARELIPEGKVSERDIASIEKKLGKEIELRWKTRDGEPEYLSSFEALSFQELAALMEALTNQRFQQQQRTARPYIEKLLPAMIQKAVAPLRAAFEKIVVVPVFREIGSEQPGQGGHPFDGRDIIKRLREMQIPLIGQDEKRDTFEQIEAFTRELLGVENLVLQVPSQEDKLYVKMHGNRLPLENYGTGIHHLVILCAALAIHSGYVVTLEEPEIHLHPELQRKFLRFIAENTENTYFITTHSNVFLDALPDANIFHVRYDGRASTVDQVTTPPAAREILSDMGYRASDLLQANGIIWVEGPSDRVYLNRWLELVAPDLVEGIHYSIAFYGGKLLAHLSCEDDPVEDLVRVLQINRHALVMVDRDGDDEAVQLNRSKERILSELGPESCWVTEGREIENYLSLSLLNRFLATKGHAEPALQAFDPNDRIGAVLLSATEPREGKTIRYDRDKVGMAREISPLMNADDLSVLDLGTWLGRVIGHIRKWNALDVPGADAGD